MKKKLLFLLPAAMLVLAACGPADEPATPTPGPDTNETGGGEETPPEPGPVDETKFEFVFEGKAFTKNGYAMLGEIPWKIDTAKGQFNYSSDKGLQVGTGGLPESEFTLSAVAFKDVTVKKVKVNASTANGAVATLSVANGETALKAGELDAVELTTTATDYEFVGNVKADKLVIKYSQPETSKGLYIKSVTVVYEGEALYVPAVESVTLTSDLTEQEVNKKVNFDYSVAPEGANPTCTLEIKSGENATLSNNQLTASEAGDVVVVAKSANDITSNEITVTFKVSEVQADYEIDVIKNPASVVGLPANKRADTTEPAVAKNVDATINGTTWKTCRATFSPNENPANNVIMLRTKPAAKEWYGEGDTAGVAYLANTIAFAGDVVKVEIDVPSAASPSAKYALNVGTEAIDSLDTTQYESAPGKDQTFTFDVTQTGIKYISVGCSTTGYNGQITAIRIFFAK